MGILLLPLRIGVVPTLVGDCSSLDGTLAWVKPLLVGVLDLAEGLAEESPAEGVFGLGIPLPRVGVMRVMELVVDGENTSPSLDGGCGVGVLLPREGGVVLVADGRPVGGSPLLP